MNLSGPIIVIDDDPDDQYLYKKAFEKMRLENNVVSFYNGLEALAFLQQPAIEPFLILCDINMPLMNGLEMREEMCKNPALCKKNTPFIFMSTSARQSDIDKAAALYTHGFFQKEISSVKHEMLLKKIVEYWSDCRYSENKAA